MAKNHVTKKDVLERMMKIAEYDRDLRVAIHKASDDGMPASFVLLNTLGTFTQMFKEAGLSDEGIAQIFSETFNALTTLRNQAQKDFWKQMNESLRRKSNDEL